MKVFKELGNLRSELYLLL